MAFRQSKIGKRALKSLALMLGLYMLINYSWVHAITVGNIHGGQCPSPPASAAQLRVADLYSHTKIDPTAKAERLLSSPVIRCLESPTWGLGHIIGTTHFAPGLPSAILLNSDGANSVDVIAHELAHAELAKLTSVIYRSYAIPTWLDEGIAMQVDHRKQYSEVALARYLSNPELSAPSLRSITLPAEFFRQGEQGMLHYAFARCVVRHWRGEQDHFLALVTNASLVTHIVQALGIADQEAIDLATFEAAVQYCLTPDVHSVQQAAHRT